VLDGSIRAAQDELRATATVVELMGELIVSQRAEIAARARPIMNGTRLQLERLQWEVAAERSKVPLAIDPRFLGFVGDALKAVGDASKDAIEFAVDAGEQVVGFLAEHFVEPIGSFGYQVAQCITSNLDIIVESLPDGDGGAPLIKSLGAAGMHEAWLSLAQEVKRAAPNPFFAELSADGSVHRLRRAAAMAKAVYHEDRTPEGLRKELYGRLFIPADDGAIFGNGLELADLHVADNSGSGCPSAIAAVSQGDERDPGPSLYIALQGTDRSQACSKLVNVGFLSGRTTNIDGIELNPGYADYVDGVYTRARGALCCPSSTATSTSSSATSQCLATRWAVRWQLQPVSSCVLIFVRIRMWPSASTW
jgi:hypothetical protein